MTPRQIDLVQATFADVKPIASAAAELFYTRLFTLDPSLRGLFKGDMARQGQMLMSVLATSVAGLRNLDGLVPVVRLLGKRHAGYGVQDQHYETVGAALLWTLQIGLKEKFTPEVKDAWTAAYALLAGVMQDAQREALAEAA